MRLNHFIFVVFSSLLLFIFTSCKDSGTNYKIPPADGRVIGNIQGVVQDNYTHQRISSAVVQYVIGGKIKSTTTDSLGYYYIQGLGTGEYELTIIASGNYARGKAIVSIPSIADVAGQNPSQKDYTVNKVSDISLYKINAGITGKLFASDTDGNMQPAPNVTVIVRFSDNSIEPAVFTTETDNDGNYVFDHSLPAYNYSVLLYSLPFTLNGVNYDAASINYVYLLPEVNVKVDNMVATIASSDVVLLSSPFNQYDLDPAANLQFVFSNSIDVNSVNIELRRESSYGTDVYFEQTWSANNTTLVMNPYALLRDNQQYYVSITGQSIDNSTFSFYGYFTTTGADQIQMVHTNLEVVEGTYTDTFPVNGNIELDFNVSVDSTLSSFLLYEYDYPYNSVPCQITFSGDKKTVTLNPVSDLQHNFHYQLQYNAIHTSGNSTYGTIYFKTEN